MVRACRTSYALLKIESMALQTLKIGSPGQMETVDVVVQPYL